MKSTTIRHEAPSSLAAFRRMMNGGARVYLAAFESKSGNGTEWVCERHKFLGTYRVAEKVTGEYAVMEGGSRLTFGKSSDWTFTARSTGVIEAQAAVLDRAGSGIRLTYLITA